MTKLNVEGIVGMCQLVSADMESDVERDEGLPFTGDNVARSLGEIRAAVQALALGLEAVARTHGDA